MSHRQILRTTLWKGMTGFAACWVYPSRTIDRVSPGPHSQASFCCRTEAGTSDMAQPAKEATAPEHEQGQSTEVCCQTLSYEQPDVFLLQRRGFYDYMKKTAVMPIEKHGSMLWCGVPCPAYRFPTQAVDCDTQTRECMLIISADHSSAEE